MLRDGIIRLDRQTKIRGRSRIIQPKFKSHVFRNLGRQVCGEVQQAFPARAINERGREQGAQPAQNCF